MSLSQPGSTSTTTNQNANAANQGQQPNIMRSNAFLRRDFHYHSNGVDIQHYLEAIDKQMTPELKKTYRIIALDDPSSLAISAIVMTARHVINNEEQVFFFTSLIESTSRVPTSRPEQVYQQTIDIAQGASDAMDSKMYQAVRAKVAEFYPAAKSLHNCGATTVYSLIDPKNADQIHGILVTAGRALEGHVQQQLGTEKPFAISWIPKDVRIQSKISYSPQPVIDASGLPLRTDISVDVVSRINNTNNQQQTIHNEERLISRLGLYVDAIYTNPPVAQFHGQVVPPQRYIPHAIITSIQSALDAETLETRLFSLLSGGLLLAKNMNWAGAFLTRHGVDPKKDLRDIGAVGYEVPLDMANPNAPLGKKVNTHAASFTRENLGELIRTAFHPQLVISFDAIELGPDSWLDETLLMAARNQPEAISAILQAANNLTDGHFSTLWKGGPILADKNNRIHIGYYEDEAGQKRDIRDLDYIALLNLTGERDLKPVIDWDKSFEDGMVDPRLRMDSRRQILRSRFEDRLVLKGHARRLTFTANFLGTLSDAAVMAGLDIRPENAQLDLSNHSGRGYQDVSSYALGVNAAQGLFNAGNQYYAGVGMPAGGYHGFTTRW